MLRCALGVCCWDEMVTKFLVGYVAREIGIIVLILLGGCNGRIVACAPEI